ncbi:hypothetical protein KJ780_05150 [Candidatus Micrarchaeota archaeon]|nr:hypothetical protein [Candidatus Micrarchaeota archaeon]
MSKHKWRPKGLPPGMLSRLEKIPSWDRAKRLAEAGFDLELIQKAGSCSFGETGVSSILMTLRNYNIFKAIQDGCAESINLTGLIMENPKPGIEIKEKRAKQYTLTGIEKEIKYSTDWYHFRHAFQGKETLFGIYFDAPVGMLLNYKGVPNAVVAFFAEKDALMIAQIQGVRQRPDLLVVDKKLVPEPGGKSLHARGLFPIEWEKILVSCVKELAKILEFPMVGIMSADKVIKRIHPTKSFDVEKARLRYDGLAGLLGFEKAENGNFYKPINKG